MERVGQEIEIRGINNSFESLGWKRRKGGRGVECSWVLFCFSNGRDWRKFKCMGIGSSRTDKETEKKKVIDSMRFPRS